MTNYYRQFKIDEYTSSIYNYLMLANLLKSLSLTNKEIEVFLKVVELGAQPASQIARVTGMPRNTVRSILDVLVAKGLMVRTRRANTQYYSPEKKETLIQQLKLKRLRMDDEIDQQISLLETYGDELVERQWAKSRPKVSFYEGVSGLEKVYEDTLTATNGLRSWASTDEMLETMPDYFKTYFKRRAAKGIRMRSIHPDTPSALDITSRDKEELRDSRLVPKEEFYWTPEVQIYDGKVNIASWKEKLGIIIESEEIADALGTFFEMCFKFADKKGT